MNIPDTITEQEFKLICSKVKKNKIKLSYLLGFYQCMRVTEVVKLMPENVDMVSGFLHIKQSKGKKDRDIPIMPELKHPLRYLPVGVSRQALHKSIKKYSKGIIHKNIHFHTLRHSGATFYLNEKHIDIRYIKDLLGHARLSTTEIYTHVTPKNLKDAFVDNQ